MASALYGGGAVPKGGGKITVCPGQRYHFEYAETGPPDAPVILLVMGLGMQLIAWPESFCEGLAARGFRVVRFDNRDAGLSTRMPSAGSLATSAMMARAFLGLPVRPPYTLNDVGPKSGPRPLLPLCAAKIGCMPNARAISATRCSSAPSPIMPEAGAGRGRELDGERSRTVQLSAIHRRERRRGRRRCCGAGQASGRRYAQARVCGVGPNVAHRDAVSLAIGLVDAVGAGGRHGNQFQIRQTRQGGRVERHLVDRWRLKRRLAAQPPARAACARARPSMRGKAGGRSWICGAIVARSRKTMRCIGVSNTMWFPRPSP